MTIRKLNLPHDFKELTIMVADSFQYPENPNWSIQEDERESIADSFKSMQHTWWLIRLSQIFIPSMRDIFNGLVYEEDGKITSTVVFQKRGSSNNWIVGTVATLPEYRRRGQARKLVECALDEMRKRNVEIAILDVIDANVPAYTLYQNLGFEHFSGKTEMEFQPPNAYPEPEVPAEFSIEESRLFDWQPRFELATRIEPESIQKYNPTEASLFRPPAFLRIFYPILLKAQKIQSEMFLLRHNETQQVIGYISLDIQGNHKGRHDISLRLDPAYASAAEIFLEYALHRVTTVDPDLMVEMSIFSWQEHVIDAALALGFAKRVQYHRMGIEL